MASLCLEVAIAELAGLQPEQFPPLTADASTHLKKGLQQRLRKKGKEGPCSSSQSDPTPFETSSKADQGCKLGQAGGVTHHCVLESQTTES